MNSCHFDFNGHRVPVWTLTYRVMRLRTEPIERPIEAAHPEHSPSWSVVLLLARGRPQPAGSHRKPSWRRRGRCLGRPAPPTGGGTRYTRVAVGKEEKSLEIIGGMKIIYRVTVLLPSLHSSRHTQFNSLSAYAESLKLITFVVFLFQLIENCKSARQSDLRW